MEDTRFGIYDARRYASVDSIKHTEHQLRSSDSKSISTTSTTHIQSPAMTSTPAPPELSPAQAALLAAQHAQMQQPIPAPIPAPTALPSEACQLLETLQSFPKEALVAVLVQNALLQPSPVVVQPPADPLHQLLELLSAKEPATV